MEYPSIFRRYIGALIDGLVVLGLFFIVARSPLISFLDSRANILIIVIFLYEPICTSRFCTLGQFAMGYRVRTLIGHERIGVFHAIWRYIVKALLGIISLITIPADRTKQRASMLKPNPSASLILIVKSAALYKDALKSKDLLRIGLSACRNKWRC